MRQKRASRDEATSAYENTAVDKHMIQRIVSRYGETHASENSDGDARMRQQRASKNEATCAS